MTTAMHHFKCCRGMSWCGSWARRVEGWGEEEEEEEEEEDRGQVTLRGAGGVVMMRRKDEEMMIAVVAWPFVGCGGWVG